MHQFRVWAPQSKDRGSEDRRGEDCPRRDTRRMVAGRGFVRRPGDRLRAMWSTARNRRCPDPRSLWQPEGIHKLSRVFDHSSLSLERSAMASSGLFECDRL